MTATQVETETSNLFPFLVDEEAHRDGQATEALLLTYNADLGFFEARLLGLLRATGARVTVIGDARMWQPDTRAVRHAGRSYHFGLCDTRAAFHPKLLVLAGPKRALAAIGSGNLTMSGWQYNSELLTVIAGDTEGMPSAFGDVRELLSSLADSEGLDPVASDAVRRTARSFDALMAAAPQIDTGHRVHASWDGRLFDYLPTDPVEELLLYAPFHDPGSRAVSRILERLRPRRVKVAVQPGSTHLDPQKLSDALRRYAESTGATYELLRDPDSERGASGRYRHGKLVEWVTTTGKRFALTGSPNLSHVALMVDVASGGNYEIAVVGPIAHELFPGGTPIGVDEIPTLRIEDALNDDLTDDQGGPLVWVAAARTMEGIGTEVHLNRASTDAMTIEVSLHSESPDEWFALGPIAPDLRVETFPNAVSAGSRIRAVRHSADGIAVPTKPVYVTGEAVLVRSTPTAKVSSLHRATAVDLFGEDLAILDSLQRDLADLARDVASTRPPTQTREVGPSDDFQGGHDRGQGEAEPWLWLQDQTVRRYGANLASWLLALPRIPGVEGVGGDVPWLDKINDDSEVGLEGDDAETVIEEVAQIEPAPNTEAAVSHRADRERLKAARRKWSARAVQIAPDVPLLSRLLILRLTIAFWSAGNWVDGDAEPFALARDLIRSLIGGDERPDELRERVGAMTAVALAVMRQHVDVTTHDERTLCYRESSGTGAELLVDLSEEAVEAYVVGLRTRHGGALTSGHVLDAAAELTRDDPLAALQTVMEERGFTVGRPAGNQIHIHGKFPTPEQIALDAVGIAEDHSPVVVWASNPRDDWTLVVWSKPDLVTINKKGLSTKWRHQRLRFVGPQAVAAALKRGGPGNLGDVVLPKHVATDGARNVLRESGVTGTEPPEFGLPRSHDG